MFFGDMGEKLGNIEDMKALCNLLGGFLESVATRAIKENPDNVEYQKRYLAMRLANTETLELSRLVMDCPNEAFKTHKQNIELAVETLLKEKEALEKLCGEGDIE